MNYTDEKLNVRCFYLKLLQKIPVSLAFSLAGALVFLFVYMAVTIFTRPNVYQADAELYLHFRKDAEKNRVYDWYNGYTWKDIIHSDQVEEIIIETLQSERFRNDTLSIEEKAWIEANDEFAEMLFSKARLETAVSVFLPSDLRLMWVRVTDKEPIYTTVLAKAVAEALVTYGEKNNILDSVEIMSLIEPIQKEYPDRRAVTALIGAGCGFLISLLYIWARFLLSDAIYVPEEAERRYCLPVIGVMVPAGENVSDMPEIFIREFRENLQILLKRGRYWKIVTDLSREGGDKIKLELESLRDKVSHALGKSEGNDPFIVVKGISGEGARVISIGEERSNNNDDFAGKNKSMNGEQIVLIAIRAGVEQGVLIEHLISQLRARGEEPAGLLFMSTDTKFLRRYYRL